MEVAAGPMTNEVAVLGVGMHPWGKWGRNFVEYGVHAAREALRDAGVEWREVGACHPVDLEVRRKGDQVAHECGRSAVAVHEDHLVSGGVPRGQPHLEARHRLGVAVE